MKKRVFTKCKDLWSSRRLILVTAISLLLFLPNAQAEKPGESGEDESSLRTWTSRNGSKLEAEFVKLSYTTVYLKKSSGKPAKIQLRELSQEDQAFVKQVAGGRHGKKTAAAKPAYETETWPKATLLVYDPAAKKWTKNGKSTSEKPNRNTDILLPAAEKPYTLSGNRKFHCRHVTIEKNACLLGAHGGGPVFVWGNCHVKEGGRIHFVDVVGEKHTYFKLDGGEHTKYVYTAERWKGPWLQPCATAQIHHKMQVTKAETGSVEFIGNVGIGDEFYLSRGKMIIGPDSEFRYNGSTAKGTFEIFDGGILELQSGAAVAPHKARSSMKLFNISVYRGGVLQAGSPERPLTKDAYVRLGFDGKANSGRNGLYLGKGGCIKVHSSNPSKARLVFEAVNHVSGAGAQGNSKGIELHLGGETDCDGVLFDYVRQGGIRLADMNAPAEWKNVFFGKNNACGKKELYAAIAVNTDAYYHSRKYMRFNRVLDGLKTIDGSKNDKRITYPSSGKIFTHKGKTKWAPNHGK